MDILQRRLSATPSGEYLWDADRHGKPVRAALCGRPRVQSAEAMPVRGRPQRAARTGRRKVNQCCRMSSVVIFGVLRPPEGCPAEPAGTVSLVIPNGLGPLDAIEPNIMNATFAGIRASIMSPSVSGVKVTPI